MNMHKVQSVFLSGAYLSEFLPVSCLPVYVESAISLCDLTHLEPIGFQLILSEYTIHTPYITAVCLPASCQHEVES